ncbi:6,7-dimethyl-8-ribityllumazine synthase [Aquicella lusitana]|uniref:6,7-dimethyl-8-ribityllumazine synthase n=1 Tax=Aquicella lusitana TaxID=254246 RepID=A0A370GH54_9COXI|nr:6,7-dimethyl-8-ribityllumazine synthase [Aquicella lusitana]RDI42576.1 6,7-dimethyl-8-ribityllumazine synthase [Aquicella lusitana]VVC74355.1 6,7-dimethyl-8-ribityllumazine synthase [Aquicella lusitana]
MKNKFAIVVSQYNQSITDKLLEGALSGLKAQGINQDSITVISVPGAVEIPLPAQLLAKSKKYAAIICLGCVIRGDTDHYDYVCEQVSQGCQRVMLDYEIPVIFGVLTTNNMQQAEDRVGGKIGHKGVEAADAAIQMVNLMQSIKTGDSI